MLNIKLPGRRKKKAHRDSSWMYKECMRVGTSEQNAGEMEAEGLLWRPLKAAAKKEDQM